MEAMFLLLSLVGRHAYGGHAALDGIGEVAFPPGVWMLEKAESPETKREPRLYVFRRVGHRLERLSFLKFDPIVGQPIENYFDAIGCDISEGIPSFGIEKEAHLTHLLKQPVEISPRCKTVSYIATYHDRDPWMSHSFVYGRKGVLVCVHASPHVLSPETVEEVFSGSRFE